MLESIRIEEGIVKAVRIFLYLLILGGCSLANAAFERPIADPVAAGMGGSGLIIERSGGFLVNPAIGFKQNVAIWWDQPYGLTELGSERVIAGLSVKDSDFGASYGQTGDKAYSEKQFCAAGSYAFAPDIRAGISASWHKLAIDGLPSGCAAVLNLGVVGQVTNDLKAAAVWKNLSQSKLSNYEDELPISLAAGLLFDADDRTEFALEFEQQPGWPTEVRMGINSRVLKPLALRGGARFNPAEYTAGFSLRHRALQVHYALLWHRDLGASHAIGLDVLLR
ncbi:MAG: hypothetical protein IPP40_03305 [bacterium]|nr:hypothetical protein [bacterium]